MWGFFGSSRRVSTPQNSTEGRWVLLCELGYTAYCALQACHPTSMKWTLLFFIERGINYMSSLQLWHSMTVGVYNKGEMSKGSRSQSPWWDMCSHLTTIWTIWNSLSYLYWWGLTRWQATVTPRLSLEKVFIGELQGHLREFNIRNWHQKFTEMGTPEVLSLCCPLVTTHSLHSSLLLETVFFGLTVLWQNTAANSPATWPS